MILEKKKNGFAGSESGSRSKPNKKFPPLAPSLISSLRPASFTCLPPHKNPQKPPEAWFRLLGIAELLAGSIPPRILRSAFEISMKSGFSICLLFLLLIVSLLSPVLSIFTLTTKLLSSACNILWKSSLKRIILTAVPLVAITSILVSPMQQNTLRIVSTHCLHFFSLLSLPKHLFSQALWKQF